MSTAKIEEQRVQIKNQKELNRDASYVLYWMEQAKRTEYNHALVYAAQQANDLEKPLIVVYALTDNYPEFNLRHFTFLLEGLRETEQQLKDIGVKLVAQAGEPAEVVLRISQDAALIVCDCYYLKHQRAWRDQVAKEADCRVVQVESDIIVPVEVASEKPEYAARTIRPKLQKQYRNFLNRPVQSIPKKSSLNQPLKGEKLDNIEKLASSIGVDKSVEPVSQFFRGGTSEAKNRFRDFINELLDDYDENRNQPQTNNVSHMSKYLHFGHISPVWLVEEITKKADDENVDAFIEELLVRRELAINFVYYTPDYELFKSIPGWAHETLDVHKDDEREYVYSCQELDEAETHDPYWNAAMREMKYTGYMHNYMRMYWGKKILEWTNTPEYAYQTVLTLNNRYFLDGGDCNSYANVSWIFGQHDRGWTERPIYGKVRSMMQSGLKRKFDPDKYVEKVDELVEMVS